VLFGATYAIEDSMPIVLCFNPGSNSLKFDIVDISEDSERAGEGNRLITGAIDDIGKETTVEVSKDGNKLLSRKTKISEFTAATTSALECLSEVGKFELTSIDLVAVRVVHGGNNFTTAVRFTEKVRRQIEALEELAPLHNANSLKVIDAVQQNELSTPIAVAFDTAFHHSLPEKAWRYPIDRRLADKHGIRKFGFHGLSHRYMLEHYAHLAGKKLDQTTLITMHLESGSSVAAIEQGRSVETSMGFTPLEGLMMGTRSGSVDPAIIPFLMKKETLSAADALNVLEKKSGLLGISGVSLDTRILRKRTDQNSKLAVEMFGYRVRQMVGGYLAILGTAEAVIFGGGIGENTPEVRKVVCDGLVGWGALIDEQLNESTANGNVCLSKKGSKLAVWTIHSDESMQLAYECAKISP
jgi:acetate kinase